MIHYNTIKNDAHSEWVVFVHGAGGSSAIWHKQLREFAREFNVLLLDLRGHGKSQAKKTEASAWNKYTFSDIAKDILDVLDHLMIKQAHFIGISLGTIVIRTLGDLQPQRVKSMVLGGAVTRLDFRSNVLVTLGNLVKRFVPYMWIYKLYAFIIMPKENHSEARKLFVAQAEKLKQSEFLRWFKLTKGINRILRNFQEKELKLPTLYVMGSEDHMFLGPVREIVKSHETSFLKVIESCGHVCNIEQPDIFNQITINFLKGERIKAHS